MNVILWFDSWVFLHISDGLVLDCFQADKSPCRNNQINKSITVIEFVF